jgi:glycosyltransferase involved in cell wall biosynthesis
MTGYGQQTAYVCNYLTQVGHDVAIFAFYGLEGSMVKWGHIPVFPNPEDDYGIRYAPDYYKEWNADILITLIDVWVEKGLPDDIRWYAWTPIDHNPMPPNVEHVLRTHKGLVKPIAMSKFGLDQMKQAGIDAFYAPHGIDCEKFKPDAERREAARKMYGWEDYFVIGSVGTNVRERKNWTAMFIALQKFAKRHKDVVMYCHTEAFESRGRNLQILREHLGIQNITFFPSKVKMLTGIETEAMVSMYNALDVYLQPSKGEGFGIPIIEAQACGVPVIVTNWTSMPELMGGGWLLKDLRPEWTMQHSWEAACNPDEIVKYLEQAYRMKKSGELAKLKIKARAKAIEYDEAKVFKEYWMPILKDIQKEVDKSKRIQTTLTEEPKKNRAQRRREVANAL